MSVFGTYPTHYTPISYAEFNNKQTNERAKIERAEMDSGGNTTRDINVKDAKGFEEAQVSLRQNQEHIKVNALSSVVSKAILSDIEVFEKMAADFKAGLTEVRTSGAYVNPAFKDNILANLDNIARTLNKSSNGFHPFGFSSAKGLVVDKAIVMSALPAGSVQDFSHLLADPNGKLTFRASKSITAELNGRIFHDVMEKFLRAQRMALSADMNATDRTQDAALASASDAVDQALDGFQLVKFLFAKTAGIFEQETEIIKDENVSLGQAVQDLGYLDPKEAIQRKFDTEQLLRTQESNYISAFQRSQRFVEKLESLSR